MNQNPGPKSYGVIWTGLVPLKSSDSKSIGSSPVSIWKKAIWRLIPHFQTQIQIPKSILHVLNQLKNHHFLLLQDPSGLPKGHTSWQRGGQGPRCDLAHQQMISKHVLSWKTRDMMRHACACAGKTCVYFYNIWFYHNSIPSNPRNSTCVWWKNQQFSWCSHHCQHVLQKWPTQSLASAPWLLQPALQPADH